METLEPFDGRFRPHPRSFQPRPPTPVEAQAELDFMRNDRLWKGLVQLYPYRAAASPLPLTPRECPTWESFLERERRRIQANPTRRAEIRRSNDGRALAMYVDDPAARRAGSRADHARALARLAYR